VFSDDIWKVEDSSAKRLDPVLKQGKWGLGYALSRLKEIRSVFVGGHAQNRAGPILHRSFWPISCPAAIQMLCSTRGFTKSLNLVCCDHEGTHFRRRFPGSKPFANAECSVNQDGLDIKNWFIRLACRSKRAAPIQDETTGSL
jgi:hypothetical protein